MALAGGAHQAWAANVFAVSTDVFPKKAIASITGLGGMAGALASMIADFAVGKWLTNSGPTGYVYAFAIASLVYLVCLGIMHLLMPNMTPLDENLRRVAA
jgi:ACS family hexuronate transporter-like MFS transporter